MTFFQMTSEAAKVGMADQVFKSFKEYDTAFKSRPEQRLIRKNRRFIRNSFALENSWNIAVLTDVTELDEKEAELEAKLTYFTDNVTMIPQNAVRLCKRSRIEMKEPSQLDGKEFAFVIKTGLGTPDFCAHADSEEERQRWIDKIVYMVQRLDQPTWLREWSLSEFEKRKEKIVERYNVAIEGERLTREQWFDAAHSVRVFLTRYCISNILEHTQHTTGTERYRTPLWRMCQETCSGCSRSRCSSGTYSYLSQSYFQRLLVTFSDVL